MEVTRASRTLRRRDEKRLVRIATEAIKIQFPNPERLGCPESTALKAIVQRDLAATDAEDVIDHIATCAPCFDEYNRQRQRHVLRRRAGKALACVTGLIAMGLGWHFLPSHKTVREQPSARQSREPLLTATLDFHNRTVERSAEARQPTEIEVPHVRRALLRLTIKLPIGTEDGIYTVQFRADRDRLLLNATGTATWDGSAEALVTTVDLRRLAPGKYVLALTNDGSWWRTYPIILD